MSEKFVYSDLGNLKSGQIVEVTLSGSSANVMLLDVSNYSQYKQGRQFSYHGGFTKQSPVRLQVPRSTHWFGVVDLRGLGGRVNANFRVLPSPLPEMREMPLSSAPGLVRPEIAPEYARSNRQYDVFISHASEDKEEVARPLAVALQAHGLEVWFDEFTLKFGDSLRRKIDEGLANSRVGLVVLSPTFLKKDWTNHELDGIVTRP